MAFFYLNKINISIKKESLTQEFKKYGSLKFVANLKEDSRNQGFSSTIVEYTRLDDEDGFLMFCKSKKIIPVKRNPNINEVAHAQQPRVENTINQSPLVANPSFHYYKDLAYGKGIEDFTLIDNFKDFFEIPNTQTFELTTIYPGLLVGSGYNHPKLTESKDDFQLGFFFDHTTGLPIISGSSIKGLLRSVCEKKEFMEDVYGKTVDLKIFEDNQTIFYDAFIISSQNKQNKIFGSDYITNHFSNEPDGMFKEPNPVKFLKVLPDVTFKFQFKAKEPDNVVDTFKQIILDFGLGAKTNVGYGKFREN